MRRLVCLLFVSLLTACAPQPTPTASLNIVTQTAPPTQTVESATTAANATPLATSPMRSALEEALGWQCPSNFAGQTLRVYNWSTYIAADTISNFETLCEVSVTYTEFNSEDDMLAAIHADPTAYDLVIPSNATVPLLVADGLLSPLNLENIPNFANVNSTLTNPLYDPENRFSVPYQWGTIGIGYNITHTNQRIVSWQQMFDYDGRVAWLNENRVMLGVALTMVGFSPNSVNPDEINFARDYLIARSTNVLAIADDSVGQDLLADGTVDIVVEYSGDIFQLIDECACDDFQYAIPREGTMLGVDNMVIPAGAQNHALAEAFIDYILQPEVGAAISNFTAYASPNQSAINMGLINEELLTNTGIYPDEATMQQSFFVQRNPGVEALYNAAWEAVVEAVSSRTPESQ
jgi:spermidine/putrescine transport system substrate-binding protein